MVSRHAWGRLWSSKVILPLYWALVRSIVFYSDLYNSRKTTHNLCLSPLSLEGLGKQKACGEFKFRIGLNHDSFYLALNVGYEVLR